MRDQYSELSGHGSRLTGRHVMLVLLDEAGCPIARTARPWDRVAVRLRAFSLDRDLAAGASPDASVTLALRAQMLVRPRYRRELARSVRRVLMAATQSPPR